MKRNHLALLLVAAMTVTSADAASLVSAADFSAEVTEEAVPEESVSAENETTDVVLADEDLDVTADESEDTSVEFDADDAVADDATEVAVEDDTDIVAEDSADAGEALFDDGESVAADAGAQGSFIPTTGVTAMKEGTDYKLTFTEEGEQKWLSFTPAKDGDYLFTTSDEENINSKGALYAANARFAEDKLESGYSDFRITLKAGQTYYYLASWSPRMGGDAGGSYTVKVAAVPKLKKVKINAGDKTSFVQGLENITFKGASVTLEYDNGTTSELDVDTWGDEYDESTTELYDGKYNMSYYLAAFGVENSNKDIVNVRVGSLKKTGKYNICLLDENKNKVTAETSGYQINVTSMPSLPSVKTGATVKVNKDQWYKVIPESTGSYFSRDVDTMLDQDFNKCAAKGNYGYYMEKGKTYYVKFDFGRYEEDSRNVSIDFSSKVKEVTFTPYKFTSHNDGYSGNWGEDGTVIYGKYYVTYENGYTSERWFNSSDNNKYYDEQGHSVELTVKDANGKIVENTKKFMTPGKYTYQFTADGVSSPVYTYTVKEPPVYEMLKEGKNLVALDDKNLPACDYYEFVPESDGFYRIKTVYGALIDVYYMDENKSYHSVDWVNRSRVFGLTKGKTYYIGLDRADAEEFDNPNGEKSITITKIADAECEWSDPVVKIPATCGKDGVAVETCKLHGDTRTITIPATGKHSYKWKVVKEATAVAAGKKVQQCSVCGKTGSTQAIAKLKATVTLNAGVNKTIPLKVKQSFQAKATGLAKGDKVVSWISSNAKIATVSKTGTVVGKKAGTAMITVKLQSGLKASFKVKVQKTDVATTSLKVVNKATGKTLKSATLKVKKTLTLVSTIAPVTSKQKVTYTSSNKNVATVNAKGVITARKKGKTTITVKSGKKAVKIQVTVK